jgi:sugar phosphate isomerase/epimerase
MSAFKDDLDTAFGRIATMGFKYVDLIAIPGWGLVELPQLVTDYESTRDNIRQLLTRHRLTPIAMNAAIANPYQRGDAAVNAQRLAEVRSLCRLMKELGIPVASFFPGGNWPAQQMKWDDVLAGEVTTLNEMLNIAEQAGVTLAVELHANTPFETVEQCTRLLAAVPRLTVAYDPSHFAMQSSDLRDTVAFLDRSAHVHLRDAGPKQMQMAVGKGTVDFAWILAQLRRRKYGGSLSVEYLPGMEGEIPAMKKRLDELSAAS